ncbi:MAG: galactose mutarotase [Oligoflexales bacterium]|nr:galactose mutarotase [Oligoflexales bacterium]
MPHIERNEFGVTSRGEKAHSFTLTNELGTKIECLNYGACLHKFLVKNKLGQFDDIVLGFDNIEGYESTANQNFGGTIGRVAGRIKDARFKLNHKVYHLEKNWNGHHLHGGIMRAFDKVIWEARDTSEGGIPSIQFSYKSQDGEEGYPGNLTIQTTYSLTDHNEVCIDFSAQTDQPTPVNLTNHTYWNLKGAGSDNILDHELQIDAHAYLACDDMLIPTGEIKRLDEKHPLNFLAKKSIRASFNEITALYPHCKGLDHTFILNSEGKNQASLSDVSSGRRLLITSSLPCLQVYSGNHK